MKSYVRDLDAVRCMMKDLRPLARLALDRGWHIRKTCSGHFQWLPPDSNRFVITSGTPSDGRALRNIKAELKRLGLSADNCP